MTEDVNAYKSSRSLNRVSIVSEKISKPKAMKIKLQLHQGSSWIFRMLIIFFKFIGLATFTHCIVRQKKRNSLTLRMFQYSELGVVYNIVLIVLMCASNYLSIPHSLYSEYPNKTNLTVGIEVLQNLLGTIVICTILLSYCVHQKNLVRIANQLMEIEQELNHLYRLYYLPLQRRRVVRVTVVACILNVCLLVVLLISEHIAFQSTPISWLTDVVPTFHVGWFMIQYFLLVIVIQANFADVNQAMQNLSRISTPDLRPQSLYQMRRVVISNSTVHQLLQLRDVHCRLRDVSEDISDFYSLPILFGITFTFVTLIYNGYYLISPLLLSDEVLQYEIFSNTVFWLIFLIYPVLLLTNKVTNVVYEMERTGNTVHNLLTYAIGKEAKSELKEFSLQLLHRKIEFTASGYFKIDNTLFQSIIGATTTYLVILVQFQMGSSHSSKSFCNCTREDSSNAKK